MKSIILFSLAVLVLACNEKTKQEQINLEPAPEISVEDFFKKSEKTSFRLSPNGEYLAYLAPYKTRMNIHVQKIDSEEVLRVTSVEDRDIPGFFWGNNDRLLYVRDTGGDENFHLYAVNKDASNEKDLTPFDGVRAQIIDDLEENESEMIIGLNKRIPQIFDPYRLNINTGEMEILYENPGNITGWKTDHDGKLRLASVTNGVDNSILYRPTENDEFKEVITTNFRQTLTPLFFEFDNGDIVYALSDLSRDKQAIVRYNLNDKKELEVIFVDDEVDAGGLHYSDKRKVLTYISYTKAKQKRKFLDKETEKIYNKLEKKIGSDKEISITSRNKNEDKLLIYTGSDKTRGSYFFYDVKGDDLKHLADLAPWINPEHMASMNPISYTSRDGIKINGYLTLPVGVEAKNLPVVVNPHGGPWARDYWGYNPEIQLLANRGYAVLQMDFRGSTGYGKEFWEMSFKKCILC